MKILIDSTFFKVYKWENGKQVDEIFNHYGRYNARSFMLFVEKILTPSQYNKFIGDTHDYVYNISKKREVIMYKEMDILLKDRQF